MKKVLFICSLYHPHIGGIETMITELSRFYRKQGIESVVLTKKWPIELAERDEYENTKIYRVVSARTEAEFKGLIRWVKDNEKEIRADIIHVVGMRRPLPLLGLLLSRYWGVPMVSTVAGSEIPNTGDLETKMVWEEGKEIIKPVLENSDIVTCVSRSLEMDLHKVVPGLMSVKTVYAGIDISFINSVACTETERKYIVSLRRLIPSKGIDILVKAFKVIANEYSDIKLLIAGNGPEEENLKYLANSLHLNSRIEFIGSVPLSRAVSLLKGAICTVVPSISEGGGLINVEAQAAGCPVIASGVGGIPEYVQDGISGILFESGSSKDLAEKIKTIISDPQLRTRLIDAGIKHARKFDWNVLGYQYLALYEEINSTRIVKSFTPWSKLTEAMWSKLTK